MRFHLVLICVIIGCNLNLSNASLQVQNKGPCEFSETINITSGHLDQNGNFHHKGIVYKKEFFAEYHYVIKNLNDMVNVEPHFRGCLCRIKPCIRLCCVGGKENGENCVTSETLIVPTREEDEEINLTGTSSYGVLVGRNCGKMYALDPQDYPDDKWFFSNGSVQLLEDKDEKKASHQDYCFRQINNNETDDITTEVLFCARDNPDDVRMTLYPIGMIFSLPFLVITFCVYGFIPELRNLHGKSLMCYVFSLMTLYISLSVVQLEKKIFSPENLPCILSGYIVYISVLMCFFWLNVMCYDIWSTFRSGMRGRGGDRKLFLMYCLYAFGVSIALTCGLYLIDISTFIPDPYRPLMGINRCWLQRSRVVEAIYLYLPISIILIINIILYSVTAYKIYQVQKEISVIRNGDSQKHSRIDADKDRFFLYLRLFIVMGSTWCMESVSWAFDTPYVFYVSDILNCLQGFIIFILFVWKPKVKQLIMRRYRSIRNLPPTTSQMNSAGSRTETSRISSGVHQGVNVKGHAEKPMLDDS